MSPYDEVGWVKNVRAAGQVTLSRGQKSQTVPIVELEPKEAAPVLKKYLTQVPITRPFFDVTPESAIADFIAKRQTIQCFEQGAKFHLLLRVKRIEIGRFASMLLDSHLKFFFFSRQVKCLPFYSVRTQFGTIFGSR